MRGDKNQIFCTIDELHVYLGVMNHLFDSLYKVMIEDIKKSKVFHKSVYDWGYDHHIVRQNYHGGCLDGPNIEKLLQNLDSLEQFVDPKFHEYIECMKHFRLVAEACFGAKKLFDDYKDRIDDFEKSYHDGAYHLSPVQAQAILDLRLHRLTGMEHEKLLQEYSLLKLMSVKLISLVCLIFMLRSSMLAL